jgi:uncharacterized membrane protein YecN with MAPEG domain
MTTTVAQTEMKPLEVRTLIVGFVLVGLAVAVTTVSYLLNMTFVYQWLVWIIGIAFAGVALITLEWTRAFRSPAGEAPKGWLRNVLLISIPLAYVLGSQVCGLGLASCGAACTAINLSLIGLGTATSYRIYRGQSVGWFLIPMVILGLTPHCVCEAPINTIWQSALSGYSPTCNMVPLGVTLFSVAALKGVRTKASAAISGVLSGMIVFMAVGNPLFSFPWSGCV